MNDWTKRLTKRAAGRYPLMPTVAERMRYKTGLEEVNSKLDRIMSALGLPASNVVNLPKRHKRKASR